MGIADAIAASLELAGERGGDLTPRVYSLLFAREPQLRELFSRDADDAMNLEGFAVPRGVFATFFDIDAYVGHRQPHHRQAVGS